MEGHRGSNGAGGALLVAIGIGVAGWFVGHGFTSSRTVDRYVTVKGLAERDVKANIALWPLRFVATADDLAIARTQIEKSKQAIMSFLETNGIGSNQVELQGLEVTDVFANPYRSGPVDNRFIINQTLMVRSEDPDRIQAVSQKVGDLIAAGVILQASSGPGTGPTFLFTKLNDLKPQMIAEATANARAAAEQFAKDSGVDVGGMRQASQGVFVILPRDQAPGVMEENQLQKTVRVVATIDYYLKD